MTDMTVKTPWHLWLVGALAVLWNGYGSVDMVMSLTQGEAWLKNFGFTPEQIAYFNAMPGWTYVAWGLGVFGGLIGAIFLLLRRKAAGPAFVLSFLGWLASVIYSFGLSDGLKVMGDAWPMQIVIGAACLFFIWYARFLTKRGVLRG